MRVIAFIGSARKNHTYTASEQFLRKLAYTGGVEYEIISLSDYNLQICRGCKLCIDRGEECCPLKDDKNMLVDKIVASDGVLFASPNYLFQVSGLMKIFLDRLAYFAHRPLFFGKAFTSIVVQGVYGGGAIVKYMNLVGEALGFNVVKGCCITALEPITEKARKKKDEVIDTQSRRYYSKLLRHAFPSPSLFKLMIFRMSRSSINMLLDERYRDFTCFKDKGWFESDYYYPVKLSPIKRGIGYLFDVFAVTTSKNR